jgi:hypothetical protein
MLRVIDRIPLPALAIGALCLGGAPFSPKPHLVEKLHMLITGGLTAPTDWFDLLMHGFLPALLALRLGRMAMGSKPD